MAPWKKNPPKFVTGPLKNVFAVTATMAELLTPPLTVAPATAVGQHAVPAVDNHQAVGDGLPVQVERPAVDRHRPGDRRAVIERDRPAGRIDQVVADGGLEEERARTFVTRAIEERIGGDARRPSPRC